MMSITTETTENRGRRLAVVAGVIALVAVGVGTAWVLGATRGDASASSAQAPSGASAGAATPDALELVLDQRVFFGHQSVGMNVLDGIPGVYQAEGLTPPPVEQTSDPAGTDGIFAHAYVGENEKPLTKLADFASLMGSGLADEVDVAFMKLCYVDITGGTDVDALFAEYRRTMDSLESAHPDVTFLHLTAPLTTDSGLKTAVKSLLGREDANRADNVARERYNELVRQAYGDTGRLFDLAAVESTSPDGARVGGEYAGATYYALDPEYASDNGHLNEYGARVAAAQLVETIARATGA